MKRIDNWKVVFTVIAGLTVFFILHNYIWPHSDSFTLDPEPKTSAVVMAARWPVPEPNDPNFLRDYRNLMGNDW